MPRRLIKRRGQQTKHSTAMAQHHNEDQHETTAGALATHDSIKGNQAQHKVDFHVGNKKRGNMIDKKRTHGEIDGRNSSKSIDQQDKENVQSRNRQDSRKKKSNFSSQCQRQQQDIVDEHNNQNSFAGEPSQNQQKQSHKTVSQQHNTNPKNSFNSQQITKKDININIQQPQQQPQQSVKQIQQSNKPQKVGQTMHNKSDPIQEDDGFCNTGDQFIKEVQKWQQSGNTDTIKKQQTKKIQKLAQNKADIQRKCYTTKFYHQFYNFIINQKPHPSIDNKNNEKQVKQKSTIKTVLFYILVPTLLLPFLTFYTFFIVAYFFAIWILILPTSAAGIQTVRMYFKCKRQKQTCFTLISGLIIKFAPAIFTILWICRVIRLFRLQAFRYDMRQIISGELSHILRCKPINGSNKPTQQQYELEQDQKKYECVCVCKNCQVCTEAKKNYGDRCFPLHSKRILCIYFPESVENIFLRKLTEREEEAKNQEEQQQKIKAKKETNDKETDDKAIKQVTE